MKRVWIFWAMAAPFLRLICCISVYNPCLVNVSPHRCARLFETWDNRHEAERVIMLR